MKPRKTRAMDMRFFWLRDEVALKFINLYWEPGSINKDDYFTKHHPTIHHIKLRSHFVLTNLIYEYVYRY